MHTAAALQVSDFVGSYVLFLSMSSPSKNSQKASAHILHSSAACFALYGQPLLPVQLLSLAVFWLCDHGSTWPSVSV